MRRADEEGAAGHLACFLFQATSSFPTTEPSNSSPTYFKTHSFHARSIKTALAAPNERARLEKPIEAEPTPSKEPNPRR